MHAENESDLYSCSSGFPNFPVSRVNDFTTFSDEVTLVIPDFNFTCSAIIFGFIVVGNGLTQQPDAKIQVWRQNDQSSVYSKLELDIPVNLNNSVCTFTSTLVDRVRLCILDEAFQVAIQPGDILGLKLPILDRNEIIFNTGGPLNYILQQQNTSIFNEAISLQVQQLLPQIVLNLTSGISKYLLSNSIISFITTFRSVCCWIPKKRIN